jgi:hypothetical protein
VRRSFEPGPRVEWFGPEAWALRTWWGLAVPWWTWLEMCLTQAVVATTSMTLIQSFLTHPLPSTKPSLIDYIATTIPAAPRVSLTRLCHAPHSGGKLRR